MPQVRGNSVTKRIFSAPRLKLGVFNLDSPSCRTALWLTGMLMSTIGSDYFPKTAEGRVLCFLLGLYAVAVCGYLTATLATYFIDQDAENGEAEIAGTKSIQALQAEITALRTEIQALARRDLDR